MAAAYHLAHLVADPRSSGDGRARQDHESGSGGSIPFRPDARALRGLPADGGLDHLCAASGLGRGDCADEAVEVVARPISGTGQRIDGSLFRQTTRLDAGRTPTTSRSIRNSISI